MKVLNELRMYPTLQAHVLNMSVQSCQAHQEASADLQRPAIGIVYWCGAHEQQCPAAGSAAVASGIHAVMPCCRKPRAVEQS